MIINVNNDNNHRYKDSDNSNYNYNKTAITKLKQQKDGNSNDSHVSNTNRNFSRQPPQFLLLLLTLLSLSLLPGLLFSLICSIVITYDTSLCAYYIFLLKSGIHFNVFTFHISNNNDNKAGMLTLKLSLLRSHILKKNYA